MAYRIVNNIELQAYNELRNSIGWDSKDEDIIAEAIKNSVIIKSIKINNKTIGMARVIGDGLYYLIVDVVVHKDFQGKGFGKILIDEIIKDVYTRTKVGQKASINLISMQGVESFYEKCGFAKIPFEYTGYGMVKRIQK